MPTIRNMPWWMLNIAVAAAAVAAAAVGIALAPAAPSPGTSWWWALTITLHLPLWFIAAYLVGGFVERVGFLVRGRRPRRRGRLPARVPSVCVQIPLFNEDAVAARVIAAAGALDWPASALEVQVLDDSTDTHARAVVDAAAAALTSRGVHCRVVRRGDRAGYKAGALENGRRLTGAEYLAIFDADFLPAPSFLRRMVPHFFDRDGVEDTGLALVQAQWGHLNAGASLLTRAQAMWVDDHHSVQMSWRSAAWGFVNFTGTAGVWRAAAIESVGGWRAASLVEDCELSFRHLFAGYRTAFASDVVAPAELPANYTAYKAQQKRWTQGWVQLQRLHLPTLWRMRTSPVRRAHLLYHMTIPWQWPAWMLWLLTLPVLIQSGLWFGALGTGAGVAVYLAPPAAMLATIAIVSAVSTRHTYPSRTAADVVRRIARVVPYAFVSAGMLPHQFSAFAEGLCGALHTEFERTPKTAGVRSRARVRIHWPYVSFEVFFVAYQLAWSIGFAVQGWWWPAVGGMLLCASSGYLLFRYGDNLGRVLFVLEPLDATRRVRSLGRTVRRLAALAR